MYIDTYNNSDSLYSFNNNYVTVSRKIDFEQIFEQTCIILSFIGPSLLLIYFSLSSPIYFHYNTLIDPSSYEIFAILYSSTIISLAKLLFASSVFSGIGVLLSGVHENIMIFSFNLFCFFLSVGFYLPTLIMYIGD
jgi:hypothetical protein